MVDLLTVWEQERSIGEPAAYRPIANSPQGEQRQLAALIRPVIHDIYEIYVI